MGRLRPDMIEGGLGLIETFIACSRLVLDMAYGILFLIRAGPKYSSAQPDPTQAMTTSTASVTELYSGCGRQDTDARYIY